MVATVNSCFRKLFREIPRLRLIDRLFFKKEDVSNIAVKILAKSFQNWSIKPHDILIVISCERIR